MTYLHLSKTLEDDIGVTTPLNLSTRGNALGIREQNDLQPNARVISGPATVIIAVIGKENR